MEPLGCWRGLLDALSSPLQPPHAPAQPAHHRPIASAAIPSLSALLLVGCLVLWCGLVYLLPPLPPATMGHLSHGNRQRKVPRNNRLVTTLSWLNLSSPLASSSKPTQWAEAVSAFSCSWPRPVPSCFPAGCEIPRNSPLMWTATQHFHGATRGPWEIIYLVAPGFTCVGHHQTGDQ